MNTSTHYVISKRHLYTGLVLIAVLLTSVSIVVAHTLVQPDRRINQVAHFGGDALYCVDRNMQATNQYSDAGEGGFRLLSQTGQELWFVPSDVIAAAVAEAKATGNSVLVATGNGTYGPTRIDAYTTGDGDDYFVFIGYDEFGKPNSIEWKFCIPVGPIPEPTASRSNGNSTVQCTRETVLDFDDEVDAIACANSLCPSDDLNCVCELLSGSVCA